MTQNNKFKPNSSKPIKGLATRKVSNILKMNISTLGYWKNAKDFRNKLYLLLKSFSEDNLKKVIDCNNPILEGLTVFHEKEKTIINHFRTGDIIKNDDLFLDILIKSDSCISIKKAIVESENNNHLKKLISKQCTSGLDNCYVVIKNCSIYFEH